MRASPVLLHFQGHDALSGWHERPDGELPVRLGSRYLFYLLGYVYPTG
jgi:hypothetical protein